MQPCGNLLIARQRLEIGSEDVQRPRPFDFRQKAQIRISEHFEGIGIEAGLQFAGVADGLRMPAMANTISMPPCFDAALSNSRRRLPESLTSQGAPRILPSLPDRF